MFLLVGLTACEQAEKIMVNVRETETLNVDTAKAKAIEALGGVTQQKDTGEEEKESEVKKISKNCNSVSTEHIRFTVTLPKS